MQENWVCFILPWCTKMVESWICASYFYVWFQHFNFFSPLDLLQLGWFLFYIKLSRTDFCLVRVCWKGWLCVRNASCNGTFSHSILLHSEPILSVNWGVPCRSRCVIPQMHWLFRLTCYKTSFMHAARSPIFFLSFHWRFGFAVFPSLNSLFGLLGGGGGGGGGSAR